MDHLTDKQIEQYRSGSLGDVEAYLQADAHLQGCARCQRQLVGDTREQVPPQALGQLMSGRREPLYHAPPEDLVDYLFTPGVAPAKVRAHIGSCARCQADIAQLREAVSGEKSDAGWLQRLVNFWRLRRQWQWIGAGAALACLLLIIAQKVYMQRTLVSVQDGNGRWVLWASGRLEGPVDLPEPLRSACVRALEPGSIQPPAVLAALKLKVKVKGNNGAQGVLLSPAGKVILTDRPTLTWRPPADATPATEYTCTLVSVSAPTYRRPPSKPVRTPSWTLPTTQPPLPRGQVYTWRVHADIGGQRRELTGPIATLPRFKVLSQEETAQLERQKRLYGTSHLLMALVYLQAGMMDEVERELLQLRGSNLHSPVVLTLIKKVSELEAGDNG